MLSMNFTYATQVWEYESVSESVFVCYPLYINKMYEIWRCYTMIDSPVNVAQTFHFWPFHHYAFIYDFCEIFETITSFSNKEIWYNFDIAKHISNIFCKISGNFQL